MLRSTLAAVSVLALASAATAQATAAAAGAASEGGWWAYRPLARPPVPAVRDAAWTTNPVDAFVLARLEAQGFAPSPAADPDTLLRRVTYDLTGLPPTDAELAAFRRDPSPAAYAAVVERLLASPQYGVRWARHWLDLVRYADTDGYERDRKKPFLWRYRDWVVDALNADLPYQDFLHRQLAGDELPEPRTADLIATGYHRLGMWDDEPTDPEQHRYDDLDGIADTTARVMLGISMGCARCHDHKKDPLPQRDYYAFLGFFENLRPYDLQARPVPADGALARFEADQAAFEQRRAALVAALRGRAENAWQALPEAARQTALQQARAGLVASYPGDRPAATELLEEHGGPAGAVRGQVVAVEGRRGQALRFDGDDHIELPRLVEGSFTVAFHVRSTDRGAGNANDTRWFTGTGLVDGEVPGVVGDWGIAWHSDGRVVAGTGDPETFVASGPGYHDGQWHHIAFTRDQSSGRIALYVDGVLAGESRGSLQKLLAPPKLVVGRLQPGGGGFRGDLDELCFYGRALDAAEVAGLALDLPGGLAAAAAMAGTPAGADGAEPAVLLAELKALRRPQLRTVEVLVVQEHGPRGPDGYVRLRGNVHARGAKVEPGFPGMLAAGLPADAMVPQIEPCGQRSSGRRTALARWITRPDHPLTWRVAANRLWQFHFGRGLVRSSNDFGRLGDLPTHPELLDWLASELVARGGSMKAMHRLLVTASTYRMQSLPRPEASERDPQNDLFWRFDRRRLSAEEVRDSILATTGQLNRELGGPSVFPPMPAAVLATASRPEDAWGRSTPEQAARRSLYVHRKRSLPEPLLAAFDVADTDNSCPVRFATVQPTQALILLNGDFGQEQATLFAARLYREAPDLRARLVRGLELVTQRPARDADVERLLALHQDLQRDHGKSAEDALQRCCLVLLNCNEFVYLD